MKTQQIKHRLMDQIERAREEYTEKQLMDHIARYERDSWTYTSPDSWIPNSYDIADYVMNDPEVIKHLRAYIRALTFDKAPDTRDRVLDGLKSQREKRQTDRREYLLEKSKHKG